MWVWVVSFEVGLDIGGGCGDVYNVFDVGVECCKEEWRFFGELGGFVVRGNEGVDDFVFM